MTGRAGTAPTIAAATFSDLTSYEVTGLEWRRARAFALANNVPIARAGRRSLIRVDRWLEAVDRVSGIALDPAPAWGRGDVLRAIQGGGR